MSVALFELCLVGIGVCMHMIDAEYWGDDVMMM